MRPRWTLFLTLATAAALWTAGIMTGLLVPLVLAAALLLLTAMGAVHALVSRRKIRIAVNLAGARYVPRGTAARVNLSLTAPLVWSPATIYLDLPAALGGPRHIHAAPRLTLDLPTMAHGPHDLGEATLNHRDLFGLFSFSTKARVGPSTGAVVPVAPRATAHPRSGPHQGHGATTIGPLPRPYVPGDDVRRIHWKATARTGDLMTRDDEPTPGDLTVIAADPDLTTATDSSPEALERAERAVDEVVTRALDILNHGNSVAVGLGSHVYRPRTERDLVGALAYGHTPRAQIPHHEMRSAAVFVITAPGTPESEALTRVATAFPILESDLASARVVHLDSAPPMAGVV